MSDDHRTPAEFWHLSGGDDIAAGAATVEEVIRNAAKLAEDLQKEKKGIFAQYCLDSLENTPDAIDLVKAAFPGVDLPDNGQPEAGLLDIADLEKWPAEQLEPIVSWCSRQGPARQSGWADASQKKPDRVAPGLENGDGRETVREVRGAASAAGSLFDTRGPTP